jgi:RNA polymerase sigma-70 factor (ECF subfamily)
VAVTSQVRLTVVTTAPTSAEDVFRAQSAFVAQLAFRILGRDSEVDDVVQDVFVAALRGLGALREPAALRSWLATLTVRKCRRRLRRRRFISALGFGRGDDGEGAQVASPDATPEQGALLSQIYRALDEIPTAERLAWTLRYVEGERLDSVAVLCQCSLATAKRRIAAAHARISRHVDIEEGADGEAA